MARPRPQRRWCELLQYSFFKRPNTKVKDLKLLRNRKTRLHSTKPKATPATSLWLSPAMLLMLKILFGVKIVACESDHRPSASARNNKSPPYGLAASSARVFVFTACYLKRNVQHLGSIVHLLNVKTIAALTTLNDYGRIRSHVVYCVIHS